jgi:hypothetical protein
VAARSESCPADSGINLAASTGDGDAGECSPGSFLFNAAGPVLIRFKADLHVGWIDCEKPKEDVNVAWNTNNVIFVD